MASWAAGKRFLAAGFALLLVNAVPARAQAVKIGVIPGPQVQVMEVVKKIAAQDGLNLDIVVFSDAARLNSAVSAGTLDANSFQDLPSLQSDIKTHGYKLADVAYTITLPMGIYSRRIKSLRELKRGDTVVIPADPIGSARALILLHNYGLIEFQNIEFTDGVESRASLNDITANRRSLKLVPVDSTRISQTLQTADAALLDFAAAAGLGLTPARDAIGMEDSRCPYAGVLVTRTEDKGKPWVAKLVKAYHSNTVKNFLLTQFNDSVRRPW
jgi:D-methionine transport system substrate-binding protein